MQLFFSFPPENIANCMIIKDVFNRYFTAIFLTTLGNLMKEIITVENYKKISPLPVYIIN